MHTENEYHRGEIFFINEGESSGSEQGGARPGIIVSNDVGNKHAPIVEVVYLTSRKKKRCRSWKQRNQFQSRYRNTFLTKRGSKSWKKI